MTTSSFSKSRLYLYHKAAWGSMGGLECCGADANQGAPWAIQSVDRWGFNIICVVVLVVCCLRGLRWTSRVVACCDERRPL
eukprot:scaffold53811_cov43-Cyclotella_meneghiniana.AAC.1